MINEDLKGKAIEIARENPSCFSVSLLQKKLKVGHMACNKLMDLLEMEGVISPYDKNRNGREVLIN